MSRVVPGERDGGEGLSRRMARRGRRSGPASRSRPSWRDPTAAARAGPVERSASRSNRWTRWSRAPVRIDGLLAAPPEPPEPEPVDPEPPTRRPDEPPALPTTAGRSFTVVRPRHAGPRRRGEDREAGGPGDAGDGEAGRQTPRRSRARLRRWQRGRSMSWVEHDAASCSGVPARSHPTGSRPFMCSSLAHARARLQVTPIRAPPVGAAATLQRPPVARTIASAIARPRPAPPCAVGRPVEAVEDPGPLGLRDPRARCRRRSARRASRRRRPSRRRGRRPARTCRRCRGGRRAAGRATPAARRSRPRPAARRRRSSRWRVSAIAPNRSTVCAGHHREVDRLLVRRPPATRRTGRARAGPRASAASASTRGRPAERRAVPGGVALLGEGEARVGLDHGQRRPQLVRGVGGEVELALAGRLDRRRRPAGRSRPRRGTRRRAGAARSAARRGRSSPRVSVTGSSDWPTTIQSSPTCAAREPQLDAADRSRSPARATVASSAGRAGFDRRGQDRAVRIDRPQEHAAPRRAGPAGGGLVRSAVLRPPRRAAAGRTTTVIRWSIWSVRFALDDQRRRRSRPRGRRRATTPVAASATRIDVRRTLGTAPAIGVGHASSSR